MDNKAELKDALKRAIQQQGVAILTGKVTKVNTQTYVCTVTCAATDTIYHNIRCKAGADSKPGIVITPKAGSYVTFVLYGRNSGGVIVNWGEIDSVQWDNGTYSLLLGKDGIIFNAASLKSYLTNINTLVEHINTIEQQLNDLKDVFKNWTPAAQDGGAQLKKGIITWADDKITETTVDDIKDKTIQH